MRFLFKLLVLLIIALSAFYIYNTYRVRDLTSFSNRINEEINAVLFSHGVEDADIVSRYQTLKSERRMKWVKYSKEINLPEKKYEAIKKDIYAAAPEFKIEAEKTPVFAGIKILKDRAVFADLKFNLVAAKARLAIVIDDLGYSSQIDHFTELDIPLTYAVIPGLRYSEVLTQKLRSENLPYILHMPMEPQDSSLIADDNMLLVSMSEREIKSTLENALESVPGASGLNNHMGSKFTSDETSVRAMMGIIKEKGLFFIDSRTSGDSLAYAIAREKGVPTAQNRFFIDNSSDYEHITKRLEELIKRVSDSKEMIAIGHIQHRNTAEAFRAYIPRMKERGIEFVKVEELLR